ncbi:MAG: hypothetical protein GY841_15430 [FCB group bacterium]|nr:hypothetical protein [FCB group bacterium]
MVENAPLNGPFLGFIVKREQDPPNDPEAANMDVLGRVKVRVPGKWAESAWAWPLGFGGSAQWGKNVVPPMGATVAIWAVEGDEDKLFYVPANHAKEMTFPEFEHPDIIVMGDKFLRLIYDRRDGQRYAAAQVVKEVNGEESLICEVRFDIEGNSVRIRSETAMVIESGGHLSIEADGDIEIGGRKLARKSGMID